MYIDPSISACFNCITVIYQKGQSEKEEYIMKIKVTLIAPKVNLKRHNKSNRVPKNPLHCYYLLYLYEIPALVFSEKLSEVS